MQGLKDCQAGKLAAWAQGQDLVGCWRWVNARPDSGRARLLPSSQDPFQGSCLPHPMPCGASQTFPRLHCRPEVSCKSCALVSGWGDSTGNLGHILGAEADISGSPSQEPLGSAGTAALACKVLAETGSAGFLLQTHIPTPHPWEQEDDTGEVAILSHWK